MSMGRGMLDTSRRGWLLTEAVRGGAGQSPAVLGAGQPLRAALSELHGRELAGHHFAREEVALHEVAERGADAVLARRHDGRVRNGDAERMAEERRHREPVGNAAHHGGLGEGAQVAQPWIARFEQAGHDEHRCDHHEHDGGHALHLHQPDATDLVVGGDAQRRRQCRVGRSALGRHGGGGCGWWSGYCHERITAVS